MRDSGQYTWTQGISGNGIGLWKMKMNKHKVEDAVEQVAAFIIIVVMTVAAVAATAMAITELLKWLGVDIMVVK